MTTVLALLMIASVAGVIATPFFRDSRRPAPAAESRPTELLERERAVALLAIKEAEFDRATGKLTADDYHTLRHEYEQRAIDAIQALDRKGGTSSADSASVPPSRLASVAPTATLAAYCTRCGRRFGEADRFCAGCGEAR